MTLAHLLALALASSAPQESAPPRSRQLMLELAAEPRLAGTSGGLQGAKVAARQLRAAGWQVEIDERVVVLSLPRRISVHAFESATAKQPFESRIERFDADALPPGDVPLYNAWSASGKVRAKVVDVGFGLRADYKALAQRKVDVRGAIALARYGRAYRGVKVDLATEHGCVGLLLFSESSGDGGERGAVWPDGPWKPDWDGQRGSILPLASTAGDPSTPGWASPRPGEEAPRLTLDELDARLPRIPCTPLGAREARALLARLDASVGPGPVEVELDLDVPRERRTIRNVLARLPGASQDPELVIAGGHRDAWVRGANDNASGCVALVRAAERLAARREQGWKPARTLVIGLWDAEEFGLIGSTEWGEANADMLRRRCVAYINCDASIAGTQFSGGGSPGMLRALRAVAEHISVPGASTSLWQDWCARTKDGAPQLGLPGAGSDHAVFAHHLGIPVVEPGFGGHSGGQYHAAFDDYSMVRDHLDPNWTGHELAGEFLAELLAQLADASVSFDAAEAARSFVARVRSLGDEAWFGHERGARLAREFELVATTVASDPVRSTEPDIYRVLNRPTLAGREWFRNVLWAPNVEDGYSSVAFPTLRAAAREGSAALDAELARIARELAIVRGEAR
ncbi:MAG: M28 family peptidase [Planctomycetes bacterium]|nr:M28 family peptidase [Planctomycetota bacterium]